VRQQPFNNNNNNNRRLTRRLNTLVEQNRLMQLIFVLHYISDIVNNSSFRFESPAAVALAID